MPSYDTNITTTVTTVNGKSLSVGLWDVEPYRGGRGDFGMDRRVAYRSCQALLICLDVVGSSDYSKRSIQAVYTAEARRTDPGMPIFIVGTQTDRRGDSAVARKASSRPNVSYTKAQGEELARSIGAVYMECSSVSKEGIKELFEAAVSAALKHSEDPEYKKLHEPKKPKAAEVVVLQQSSMQQSATKEEPIANASKPKEAKKDCVIL